ncbi:MAG: GNAT family N-acetyltransferase [Oscillospiraceae bacterium]|nr:GNAT family N-acetyltransferase [Oscillospiraceae bacterium]
MISLRSFRPCDWQVITKYQYTDLNKADAVKLIAEFNAPTYQGQVNKLLAITDNVQVVGYVSFIETASATVSIGVEVYAPFRRQGYAYAALLQLLTMANAYGYHTAAGQVRKDNTASLALCRKLGFSIVSEGISKRGKPVYNLVKSI